MKLLQIPTPCHESWDEMQPESKGKLCHMCDRKVVNFAVMKDEEIVQYMQNDRSGRICGRLKTSQLNRPLAVNLSLRSMLLGASLSGALLLESCDTVKKADQPVVSQQTEPHSDAGKYTNHYSDTLISGIVRKSDGTKARHAQILLFYDADFLDSDTVYADKKGAFSIPVNPKKMPNYLEFSHGNEYSSIKLREVSNLQNMIIQLEELMIVGEVIILDK